jgi:hypothetical protein
LGQADVSVSDAAKLLGRKKQHIFKVLSRLEIEKRFQKSEGARGQKVAYISAPDFERVKLYLQAVGGELAASSLVNETSGVFYLIQLEPTHDPRRFKLGFASNMEERMRAHHTAAPLAKLIKTWPCKLLWEKTAIDSITRGYQRLHTEVFRGDPVKIVLERCDQFFVLMPDPDAETAVRQERA